MIRNENPLRAGHENGAAHGRNETKLPDGWIKDYTDDGEKYYANGETGESSWDAPPGATGGSTGISAEGETVALHSRNETAGFVDGDKYYVDANGDTTWDEYTL